MINDNLKHPLEFKPQQFKTSKQRIYEKGNIYEKIVKTLLTRLK